MNWGGLNNALFAWRNGVNALFPNRSTRSDGGRADSNHASTSQHQPDSDGTVDAFDEDRNYLGSSDQDGSAAEDEIKAALDRDFMADPRAHLIITDRTIRNDEIGNWRVRPYGGSSPHTEHTHRQVHQSLEDDGRPWKFPNTMAVLRRQNGDDDVTPEELLNTDSVPNLYSDKATNKTVTVRTALKAAVAADVRCAELESLVRAQGTQIAGLQQTVQTVLDVVNGLVVPPPPPSAR